MSTGEAKRLSDEELMLVPMQIHELSRYTVLIGTSFVRRIRNKCKDTINQSKMKKICPFPRYQSIVSIDVCNPKPTPRPIYSPASQLIHTSIIITSYPPA
jgi:hypothetical protein